MVNPILARLAQHAEATGRGEILGRAVPLPIAAIANTIGLALEPFDEAAKAVTGASMVASAKFNPLIRLGVWDSGNALSGTRLAREAEAGFDRADGNIIQRLIAANEAAAAGDEIATGLMNVAHNPLNFVGPVGRAGSALRASGKAPAIGNALVRTALAGEGLNRASALPFYAIPGAFRAGRAALGREGAQAVGKAALSALLERPTWLDDAAAPAARAAAPEIAGALESLGQQAEARRAPSLIPKPPMGYPARDTAAIPAAARLPLDPDRAEVNRYLRARGLPQLAPEDRPMLRGVAQAPDPLAPAAPNLIALARRGAPVERARPGQAPLAAAVDLPGLKPSAPLGAKLPTPPPSGPGQAKLAPATSNAGETASAALTQGLDANQLRTLELYADALRAGDQGDAEWIEGSLIEGMGVRPETVAAWKDRVYAELDDELHAARIERIEQSPFFSAFQHFNPDGTLKRVNPKTGEVLRVQEGGRFTSGRAEVWNIPGSGYDEVAAEAIEAAMGGHNQNWQMDADDFWPTARDAFRAYRALKSGKPLPTDVDLAGLGITPGELLRPLVSSGLPALAGGGVGYTAGGLLPADSEEERDRNRRLGAAIGGAIGGGAGFASGRRLGVAGADETLGVALSGQTRPLSAWGDDLPDVDPAPILARVRPELRRIFDVGRLWREAQDNRPAAAFTEMLEENWQKAQSGDLTAEDLARAVLPTIFSQRRSSYSLATYLKKVEDTPIFKANPGLRTAIEEVAVQRSRMPLAEGVAEGLSRPQRRSMDPLVRPEDVLAVVLKQTPQGEALTRAITGGSFTTEAFAQLLDEVSTSVRPFGGWRDEEVGGLARLGGTRLREAVQAINEAAMAGESSTVIADRIRSRVIPVNRVGEDKAGYLMSLLGAGESAVPVDANVKHWLGDKTTPEQYVAFLRELYPEQYFPVSDAARHQYFWDVLVGSGYRFADKGRVVSVGDTLGTQTGHIGLLRNARRDLGEDLPEGLGATGGTLQGLDSQRLYDLVDLRFAKKPSQAAVEAAAGGRPVVQINDRWFRVVNVADEEPGAFRRGIIEAIKGRKLRNVSAGKPRQGYWHDSSARGPDAGQPEGGSLHQTVGQEGRGGLPAPDNIAEGSRVDAAGVGEGNRSDAALRSDVLRGVPGIDPGRSEGVARVAPSSPTNTSNTTGLRPGFLMSGDLGVASGMVPAAVARTSIGMGAGGIAGGVAGFATADEGASLDERLDRAGAGALAGGAIGGGLGASPEIAAVLRGSGPQLRSALQRAIPDGSLLTDEILGDVVTAVQRARDEAGQPAKNVPGGLLGVWKKLAGQWSRMTTDTVKQIPQDALYRSTVMEGLARDEFPGLTYDYIRSFQPAVSRERATGAVNLANPFNRLLVATGHADFLARKGDILGTDFTESLADGARFGRVGSTIAGAAMSLGAAVKTVNPLAVAFGGARGAVELEWSTAIRHLIGTANDAFRYAMGTIGARRELATAAGPFLDELAARGVDVTALRARQGLFSGDEVAALAGPQAGQAWAARSREAILAAGDRVAFLAGDFRDKLDDGYLGKDRLTTGERLRSKGERAVSKVVPFARWQLRSTPVLAEIARRHPRGTALLAAGSVGAAQQAEEEQLRPYQAGTVPATDETPGIGGLVRARLGGLAGTVRANPLAAFVPYGPENLLADDLPDDPTGYQRATNLAGRVGFSANPIVQALAYVAGQDYRAPGNLSRTAGLEGLADVPPVLLRAHLRSQGQHAAAEAIPDLAIPSGRALLDAGRTLLSPVTGAGVSDSTPELRRYAELVLAETGLPISDPSNAEYVTGLGKPGNGLWDRAVLDARMMAAAGNVASMTAVVATTAQTEGSVAAQAAGKLPWTDFQISQMTPQAARTAEAENAAAIRANPAIATYRRITGKARRAQLLQDWEERNAFIKRRAPGLYAERRRAFIESLP